MSGLKRPGLVGQYIREKREKLGLSQRALGQLFTPTVTTQFISNVERGVTPLPPVHAPTLIQALQVPAAEFLGIMEREYSLKLSDKLGHSADGTSASTLCEEARRAIELLATGLHELSADAAKRVHAAVAAALKSEGAVLNNDITK